MSLSGIFEIGFLVLAVLVIVIGTSHTRTFVKTNPTFSSHADLDRYQEYVTFQMWCTVAFLAPMVCAIGCGIYYTWSTPGLIAYLPIAGYWVPALIGRSAKGMEERLRTAAVPPGELKDRHELISFVWKKKFFPRF